MRECKIILPADGDLSSLARIEALIIRHYKGYTKTIGQGAWVDHNGIEVCEDVLIYGMAVGNDHNLRAIAKTARTLLRQGKVYIKYCDGDVELV